MAEPTLTFQTQVYSNQFKIPIELIKKNLKSIQKLIEKQRKVSGEEITKISKNPALPASIKLQLIKKVRKSFESYRQKLQVLEALDYNYRERLTARNAHLQQLRKVTTNGEILDLNNYNLINWYRLETQVAIVEYLIKTDTSLYANTQFNRQQKSPAIDISTAMNHSNLGVRLLAYLSQQYKDLPKLIDYDLFNEFNLVYNSISRDHDLSAITTWFNDNKQSLKKVNSNLEFEIKYCKLLSMIREGQVTEAIAFSHANLSNYGNKDSYEEGSEVKHFKSNLHKLEKIGAYLVYLTMKDAAPTWTSTSIAVNAPNYKDLERSLNQGRWETLAQCFVDNFITLYGLPQNHSLFIYLSSGLCSLKTKSCYCNEENDIYSNEVITQDKTKLENGLHGTLNKENCNTDDNGNDEQFRSNKRFRGPNQYYKILGKINNCPVCSPELYQLSKNLPFAQLITNIFNNPFKLPNGNIYPFDKLVQNQNEDIIRSAKVEDPLTKEIFLIDDCIRVYPA